jgi:hypothetical protein
MPVVRVSCLPADLTEEQLRDIHKSIVAEAMAMPEFGIKDERHMTVLFPPDMMSYGLGSEIIIEVLSGAFDRFDLGIDSKEKFARAMVRAVKKLHPEPMVECFIHPFGAFYGCLEGQAVPDEPQVP